MRPTSTAAALAAIAALALTACESEGADGGGDAAGPSGDDTAVRLTEMINESDRLRSEVAEAESRLTRACLESQGFTVHDEHALAVPPPSEQDSITTSYPFDQFLPPEPEAAQWGFGAWVNTEEAVASGEADQYFQDQAEQGSRPRKWTTRRSAR
ncbi:hypothetical protein GCM10029992_19810 [Glycomyces albus]